MVSLALEIEMLSLKAGTETGGLLRDALASWGRGPRVDAALDRLLEQCQEVREEYLSL